MPTQSKAGKSGTKPVKAAAKPASKSVAKPATKSVAKSPAAAKKVAAKPAESVARKAKPGLTPEQRRYYVEVAAYYIAERRGFHGGSELDDWMQAENEIDRLLNEGVLNP